MRIHFAVAVFALFSIAAPCRAQTFNLYGNSNCPGLSEGLNFPLFTGTYHIHYVSGAYSWFSNDLEWGGHTWASRVNAYVYATGESYIIGSAPVPGLYFTAAEAEAAAVGIYQFEVPANSMVSFSLPDHTACDDNRGFITLRFGTPLPVQAATWGSIKALYR